MLKPKLAKTSPGGSVGKPKAIGGLMCLTAEQLYLSHLIIGMNVLVIVNTIRCGNLFTSIVSIMAWT